MDYLHRLDERVFFAINHFAAHTGWLHAPMEAYANYGVVLFGVLLALAVLRARGRSSRELAAVGWAGLGMLLALWVNQPLGNWAREPRPYTTHAHVLLLAHRSGDFSFPSDHAVMAGAVAAGLLIAWRRLGVVAAVLALLMAFARVYVGAHYPWDVLAGLLVGAVVVTVGWVLLARLLTAVTERLRRLPLIRTAFPTPNSPLPSAAASHGSAA